MLTYTGFDSAWGGRNSGAVCHLAETAPGRLELDESSWRSGVTWATALDDVRPSVPSESHIIAIDQPLVVPNETGSRPVDVTIARALMSQYEVGAHAANRANPCFGDRAGIWRLLEGLETKGYRHVCDAGELREPGRYVFECYPNLALIGWLDTLPRYKVRHRDREAWNRVLEFLRSLTNAAVQIVNADTAIRGDLEPTKVNEDKIDALIAAYTAAWHRTLRGTRSMVLGEMSTGYIVTPTNDAMQPLLLEAWSRRDVSARRVRAPRIPRAAPSPAAAMSSSESKGVELVCVHTTNLWGRHNGWMTKFEGAELVVQFIEEDGEPTVRFVPFASGGATQRGMKVAQSEEDRARWLALAAGTSAASPRSFPVSFWYEDVDVSGSRGRDPLSS